MIGLTTAIKIQERGGYHVTVIAEALPGDPMSSKYTSPWAVSRRFVSSSDLIHTKSPRVLIMSVRPLVIRNKRVRGYSPSLNVIYLILSTEMDQDTFDVMWEMSKPGGEAEGCFLRIHQTDHFTIHIKDPNPARGLPDASDY